MDEGEKVSQNFLSCSKTSGTVPARMRVMSGGCTIGGYTRDKEQYELVIKDWSPVKKTWDGWMDGWMDGWING